MKTFKTIILLLVMLAAGQMSGAEFTGGSITLTTPDGDMTFPLPQTGFEVADYTGMGQAPTLVVKSFEATTTGDVANATLMGALYQQGQSPEEWMQFPLTNNGNGTWGVTINQDLVEVAPGPGEYVLEVYVKGNDANGNQLLLNNGGENYKVMFALGGSDTSNNVRWLTNRAAEIFLSTDQDFLQYRYNGDGSRDNETMPGAVDMLAINFFGIYYDLAENVEITHASLQYMICLEGETEGLWNTIECNELNTLASSRTNTHRSTFMNEQRIITHNLEPGNYVLRIMFQLIDDKGNYYFFGRDNDNFVFNFTMNEPPFPDILGISMSMTTIPEQEVYPWAEAGVPFETIDLTNEEPLEAMTIDEVIIFAQGNFDYLDFYYKVCDESDNEIYRDAIPTSFDDFGNWSTDTSNSYEVFKYDQLQNGKTYHFYFWAEGGAQDDQLHTLDDNFLIKFVYGGPDSGTIGDLDGNDVVDIDDLNLIINMMLGKNDQTAAADINGDGNVDIDDMNIIINIMLGKN